MNIIEQVGLSSDSDSGYAYTAVESVQTFGKKLLIPELLGSNPILSIDELTGLQQFLTFLSNEGMGINTPSDVWKFATFISYIADFRDIAAITNHTKIILTDNAFTTETNILQSATYTLTTFSGECSAYARLYSATQTILNAKTVYNVFFTPDNNNQGGHVTDVWTTDDQTWHVSDYFVEYIGPNPLQLLAWLWATQYPNTLLSTSDNIILNGWSGFSITVVKNDFFAGNYNQTSFLTPVMSAHIDYLLNHNIVNIKDTPSQAINYIQQSTWGPYQQLADKTFQIEYYGNTSSSTPLTQIIQPAGLTSQSKSTYIVWGLIIAIALIALIE